MALATATDPNVLLANSKCDKCIPVGEELNVVIYLLQQIAGTNYTTDQLLSLSKCYKCIPVGDQLPVVIMLLDQIATANGV